MASQLEPGWPKRRPPGRAPGRQEQRDIHTCRVRVCVWFEICAQGGARRTGQIGSRLGVRQRVPTRMRKRTGPPSEMTPVWRADFRLGIRILAFQKASTEEAAHPPVAQCAR